MKKKILFIVLLILSVIKAYASPVDLYNSTWTILRDNFYDKSMNNQDWNKWKDKAKNLENYEQAYDAIYSMIYSLNDPYTIFLRPSFYNEEKLSMAGKVIDYGIRLNKTRKGFVIYPLKDSIAQKRGIEKKDLLLKINNKPINEYSSETLYSLLFPAEAKDIELLISRDNEEKNIKLTSSEENVQSIFHDTPCNTRVPDGIVYIRIPSFMNKNVAKHFKDTVDSTPDAKAYIIDLRNNGGGVAKNGAVMANMLLKNCVITTIEDRNGAKDVIRANEHLLTSKPIVVLSNGGTASASEIFIAAIKEHKRGAIIGEKTFGKAVIQDVFDLPDGCGMNVTVRRYLTPKGNDIRLRGIEPDIKLKPNRIDVFFRNDIVLERAIKILEKNIQAVH
jgi:carboxyl-terminal processing protease